ncbi:MAG: hypothetical protein QG620_646 [Patescibacteria group bacterium]|nr:hypothetical protein [Patescibacteria group bacterium]
MRRKQKSKYKSIITKRITRSLHKLGVTVLMVALFVPILTIRGTSAGFFDEEKSEENSVTAGILDGVATQTSFGYTTGSEPMEPGDAITQEVDFTNQGDLPFQYKVKYLKTDDGDLCEALTLTAKKNSTVVYDKLSLEDFDMGSIISPVPPVMVNSLILDPAESDDWTFVLELPADSSQTLEDETCEFNFKFTAWQTDFIDNSLGFWDEELADPSADGIEIKTGEWEGEGDVVINEIMWMGNSGNDNDEWIELRNMTNEDIDISNWNIVHGGSGVGGHIEIPSGYSIKASGYFLITKKKYDETAINLDGDLDKDEGYTHVSNMSLLQTGEDLILQNENNITIDTAWKNSTWPAGCNDKNGVCEGLYQSMEREDIPGDGTLSASWHTCISGNCNDGTYWDSADGNNYGTPGAANLSPVVMNEFVANSLGDDSAKKPGGEWIELFNISERKVDVSGWYFKNSQGEKIIISEDNARDTEIAGGKRLVVYLEEDFLDNDKDTLSFYNGMGMLEDIYKYEKASEFPEGKSFARFPDGVGIWIDPEATPGEENKLDKKEMRSFRFLAYEECFDGEKVDKKKKESVCNPVFLEFLGMIKNANDKTIDDDILLDILEMKKEKEEKKLAEMLKEIEKLIVGQIVLSDTNGPVGVSDLGGEIFLTESEDNDVGNSGEGEGKTEESEVTIGEKEGAKTNNPVIKEEDNNSTDLNNEW